MRAGSLTDVLGGIVLVALVTTVVAHKDSAAAITAIGRAFSGSISAALGK